MVRLTYNIDETNNKHMAKGLNSRKEKKKPKKKEKKPASNLKSK
jgi:hypothetical protein